MFFSDIRSRFMLRDTGSTLIVPIIVDVDKQMWLCALKHATCRLYHGCMQPDKDTEPSFFADLIKIVRVRIKLEQVMTSTMKMTEGKFFVRLLVGWTHVVDSFNELILLHVLGALIVWKEL